MTCFPHPNIRFRPFTARPRLCFDSERCDARIMGCWSSNAIDRFTYYRCHRVTRRYDLPLGSQLSVEHAFSLSGNIIPRSLSNLPRAQKLLIRTSVPRLSINEFAACTRQLKQLVRTLLISDLSLISAYGSRNASHRKGNSHGTLLTSKFRNAHFQWLSAITFYLWKQFCSAGS